jgi:hypothetical protein
VGQDQSDARTVDGGRRWWVIPVATFLVGLVAGGLFVGLTGMGSDGTPDAVGQSAEPSSSPTESGPEPLVVPGACVQVATDSQQLLELVGQAADAARDLDAARLSGIVADLQAQQQVVSDQAAACQSAAASASPQPSLS